jgi:hypothetical protein
MASVPYRTADATLARFGAVVARYGHSKLAIVRSFVMLAVLSLLGVSSCVAAVDQLQGGRSDGIVVNLAVGVIMCTAALGVIVRALRSRGLHLELRQHGLIRRARGAEVGMLWEDVAEVRISRRNVRRWERNACTLLATDRRRLELTDELSGIAEVCSRVEQENVRRQLPRALADVQAGRAVAFGPFAATRDGLSHRERLLPWKEVGGAAVVQGLLVIGDTTRGIRILPKRDGIIAWARHRYADVPNAAVLLALVEHSSGDSPEAAARRSSIRTRDN